MIDRKQALVLCTAVAALGVTACEDLGAGVVACDRPDTPEPLPYKGGAVKDGCVYSTSDFDGELLYFPGGAWYEIHHQLNEVPDWFEFYLSFERFGVAEGSLALASGNQAEVKAISDQAIVVLNGSCVDYWLLGKVGIASCGPEP